MHYQHQHPLDNPKSTITVNAYININMTSHTTCLDVASHVFERYSTQLQKHTNNKHPHTPWWRNGNGVNASLFYSYVISGARNTWHAVLRIISMATGTWNSVLHIISMAIGTWHSVLHVTLHSVLHVISMSIGTWHSVLQSQHKR